jgi:hypothetical protein
MDKQVTLTFFILVLFGCSSGGAYSSKNTSQVVVKEKITKVEKRSPPPAWFITDVDDAFYFVVKNTEKSGSKNLSETKNLLISEILLANTMQQEFMTSTDQKAIIKSIRASSSLGEIKKYMDNQYVKAIISGYAVEHSVTLPYDTGFINYVSIKHIKE